MKKLVIISHTGHQITERGEYVGWGPTINEINHLSQHWEKVIHVACLEEAPPKGSSLAYKYNNIEFVAIPTFGGKSALEKLGTIKKTPLILKIVSRAIVNATHVQLRVPMGIGVFLIPYFAIRAKRDYVLWIKYANNWVQKKPPLGYWLQRAMLKSNIARAKVTINGFWPNQPKHCISFENPSLNLTDLERGKKEIENKSYSKPFVFTFVGRLESEKGVGRILDALKLLPSEYIAHVNFIGDSPEKNSFEKKASFLSERVSFHGFLPKEKVVDILAKSHFFLFPSTASEGFPKVIAEASCFGAIPIVSDVASISHYIRNEENGYLWESNGESTFISVIRNAINKNQDHLEEIAKNGLKLARLFTLERYVVRIKREILNLTVDDQAVS